MQFIDDLRRKLADGSLTSAERQRILRSRPEVLKREMAVPDYIPRFLEVEGERARRRR